MSRTTPISSSPSSDDSSTIGEAEAPPRPVFCLKSKDADLKEVEDKYDCFILDFDDPLETLNTKINELSVSQLGDGDDLSVVAEKGQVACRDYPHSRHLCLKYPFDKHANDRYCELCYCYVCDTAAQCLEWTTMLHCDASDKNSYWRNLRAQKKGPLVKSLVDESP